VAGFGSAVGVHVSFVVSPNVGGSREKSFFSINHYAGNCSYYVAGFVEKNTGMLDSAFVFVLRNSSDPFVSKLLSGPSLAAKKCYKDESIVILAQISSRNLPPSYCRRRSPRYRFRTLSARLR
jgi:chitin synthase